MYDVLLALKVTATGTALALTTTQGGTAQPAVDVSTSDGSTTVTVDVPGLTAADLQKLPSLIKEKLAELAAKAEAAQQAKEALAAAKEKAAAESANTLPAAATKSFADPDHPCGGHWGDPGSWGYDKSGFDPAYAQSDADEYYGHHSWGHWGHDSWGHGGYGHHDFGDHDFGHDGWGGYHG
jgi:hypothetical protein